MGGGQALLRMPTTVVRTQSASGWLINLRPSSTTATIREAGILCGAGARLRPLANTDICDDPAVWWGITPQVPRPR